MKKRFTAALATFGLTLTGLFVPVLTGTAQAADRDASGAAYDQFIVTFTGSASAHRVSHRGVSQLREMADGSAVVKAPRRLDRLGAQRLMRELASQPGVASVEPDLLLKPMFSPNDTRYGEQWDLFEPTAGMNAP